MSSSSNKRDAKTEKKILAMRTFFAQSPLPSLSVWQLQSTRERPVVGPIWISRVTFPAPESAIRDVLFSRIRALAGDGLVTFAQPSLVPVKAEWTGYRKGACATSPEPEIPESGKYQNLINDVSCNLTILYVHGGGYCRGSPAGWRSSVGKLAQLTGGRCISVQYRLAPQNPFPAALLDILVVYLSLLYPSSESLHDPVPSGDIVLAGDSCGATLCLSIIQLILDLHRQSSSPYTIFFNGKDRPFPLPGGIAVFSALGEATNTLPSWIANKDNDYFSVLPPIPRLPSCDLWPTSPSRGHVYCELNALCHPLVSPAMAESWVGAPPMWFCCGEEMLVDGNKVVAQRAAGDSCTIIWTEYKAMPHCFPFVLEVPQTQHSLQGCARFCKTCVESPSALRSEGVVVHTTLQARRVDVKNLINLSFDEAKSRAQKGMKRQIEEFGRQPDLQSKL